MHAPPRDKEDVQKLYLSLETVKLWLLVVHVLQNIFNTPQLLLGIVSRLGDGRVTR